MPIWEIAKSDLFQAFGYQHLKSRKELRAVGRRYRTVAGKCQNQILIKDAVALGLMARRY